MNGLLYSIMYPIVMFPSNFIIEKYGLKIGMLTGKFVIILGEMFIILGLLIRLLVN